jgi:hypothetical protein
MSRAAAPSRAPRPEPLERSVDHLLEECRMVLPGVQALFGFQLIAVFNAPFFDLLTAGERRLHLVALVLVSLSVACLMGPAAYHRQAEPETVSRSFVSYAGTLLMLALVPLMFAVSLDVYLIARVVLGDPNEATIVAAGVFAVFAGIWFVLPQMLRAHRRDVRTAT